MTPTLGELGAGVIVPPTSVRGLVATKPVDFRKGIGLEDIEEAKRNNGEVPGQTSYPAGPQ
jgi:hypothetical protein